MVKIGQATAYDAHQDRVGRPLGLPAPALSVVAGERGTQALGTGRRTGTDAGTSERPSNSLGRTTFR